MASRLSVRQWSALRALAEGEAPTNTRLAAAGGIGAATVRLRAAKEGWRRPDCLKSPVVDAHRAVQSVTEQRDENCAGQLPDVEAVADPALDEDDDPIGRLGRLLSRQARLILATAEAQEGALNKPQLEALTSLIKLAEKFETLAKERVQEQPMRSDDEIAAVLERIDDRIVELAEEHAERLGAEKSDR